MDLGSKTIQAPQPFLVPEMRSDGGGSSTNTIGPCDLGSLLSFSCRNRAESFARKLHFKLKTLGSLDGSDTESGGGGGGEGQVGSGPVSSISWHNLDLEAPTIDLSSSSSSSSSMPTSKPSPLLPSPDPRPSAYPSSLQPANSSSDSDIFYDFDLGSPGSPVENGSCFTVINPCDDLYCTDCVGTPSANPTSGRHTVSAVETDSESGCVFSSPASTSPDGYQALGGSSSNGVNGYQTSSNGDDVEALTNGIACYKIEHCGSADDCTSDASDSSIYYDVESFPDSPKPPEVAPPPKVPSSSSPFSVSDRQLLIPPSAGDDDEDDEGDNGGRERLRLTRSSSLKTGKTPPGTPGRKKIVRFADALGLDLADVRTFLDEIPNVPKSAYRDLECPVEASSSARSGRPSTTFSKLLVPTFHQPVSRPDFFDRIRDQKVLLENAFLSDNFTIKGTVRVMNMDFYKSVYIRYTLNEWKTFTELQGVYVNGSCDGFSDRFEFGLTLTPDMIEVGSRLTLAVRFHCKGEQFWDNNGGQNYLFHCVPSSTQSSTQGLFHQEIHHHAYSGLDSDPWTTHLW